MTPTEKLCAMLDERGVEYRLNESTKLFEWHFEGTDGEGSAHATEVDGGINIMACSLTPEQAIAATLGAGTCEWCKDGETFDGQTVMMTNHGWQRIRHCPNCGRRLER